MLQPLTPILLGITAIHAANKISIPPISIDTTDAYLVLDDNVLSANLPDPRFHVSSSFDAGFLPPVPTLMGILFFVAEMAYGNINATVPANTWTASGHPQVEIITVGPTEAKYLLFGVFAGIEYMVKYNRFQEVLLTLRWERSVVGRIWIVLPGYASLGLPANDTVTNKTMQRPDPSPPAIYSVRDIDTNASMINPLNGTKSLGNDVEISITTIPGGRSLTRNDVFLTCYAALVHMAPFSRNAQMADFTSKMPLNDVYMHLLHWGPGIEYSRVIQAMSFIPGAMLNSPEGFREVRIRLYEEDIMVLEATIQRISPQDGVGIS